MAPHEPVSPEEDSRSVAAARKIRDVVQQALPVVGLLIVLGGALFITQIVARVLVVAVGLIVLEVAVWNLASGLLPNTREYTALRTEIDRFIGLARRLNSAALALERDGDAAARAEFNRVYDEMIASVHHMTEVAGVTATGAPHAAHAPQDDARPPETR